MKSPNRNPHPLAWLAATALLVFPHSATAREKAGNGGFSLVCRDADGNILSARLWDFYEAENPDPVLRIAPIKIAFDPEAKTVRERVDSTMKRIAAYAPSVKDEIQPEAEKLLSSIEHFEATGLSDDFVGFTDRPLPDVFDSRHLTLPPNCKVEPTIIRIDKEAYPDEIQVDYLIQKQIWMALANDPDSRAGFVQHEAIYKHADTKFHQENSISSRYLNAYVSSDGMEKNGWMTFVNKLIKSHYKRIVSRGGETIALVNGFGPAFTPRPDGMFEAYGTSPALGYPIQTLVVNADGETQAEPTRLANPRKLSLKGTLWFTQSKLNEIPIAQDFNYSRDMTRIPNGTSVSFVVETADGRQTCEIPQSKMRKRIGDGFEIEFDCEFTVYHGKANYRLDIRSNGVRLRIKQLSLKHHVPNALAQGVFFVPNAFVEKDAVYSKTGEVNLN